jgi:pimeloyl-ACP methyl ester carboxylesterase
MEAPETRYAHHIGHHIGYQVWGSGPIDVLEFNNGLMISIDETLEEPSWLRYEQSLASSCRLIRFDALGLGLSDPLPTGVAPSIEAWATDAVAVLDEVGIDRADVVAPSGGSLPAVWLAAHQPQRVRSLVLVNGTPGVIRSADYPIGVPDAVIDAIPRNIETPGGSETPGGRRQRDHADRHRRLRAQPGPPGGLSRVVGPGGAAWSQSGHRSGMEPDDVLG